MRMHQFQQLRIIARTTAITKQIIISIAVISPNATSKTRRWRRRYRYQPPISEKVTNVFCRRLFDNANVDDLDKLHDWRETFSSANYYDPWRLLGKIVMIMYPREVELSSLLSIKRGTVDVIKDNNDDDDNQSSLLLSRSSSGLIIQGAAPRAGKILRRMEVCTPPSYCLHNDQWRRRMLLDVRRMRMIFWIIYLVRLTFGLLP